MSYNRFRFGAVSLRSVLLQGEFPSDRESIPVTKGGRRLMVHVEELPVVESDARLVGRGIAQLEVGVHAEA